MKYTIIGVSVLMITILYRLYHLWKMQEKLKTIQDPERRARLSYDVNENQRQIAIIILILMTWTFIAFIVYAVGAILTAIFA